jgi:exodeoxyribonuclease VII small subunit
MTELAKSAQGEKKQGTKETANAVENGGIADLPFEKALAELETIVGRLERGDVPLEESIAIYERGEALKLRCEALLKLAEARIERITLSAQGKPVGTTPLDEN